jgi:hypothetical protein
VLSVVKAHRLILPVVLFVLLASSGTVWLIRVAREAPAAGPSLVVEASGGATVAGTSPAASRTVPVPRSPVTSGSPAGPGAEAPKDAPAEVGGGAAPSPVVSPRPRATTGPQAPPIPERAIRVGGVTLDDTSPRTMCYLVRNDAFDQTVRIAGLVAGNPDVVIQPDRCAGTTAVEAAGTWTPTFACRVGADLLPGGDGCYTGIEPKSASTTGDLRSSFTATFRTRCSSATGHPCSDSGSPNPTAARPVDVTWTQPFDETLCFRNEPGEAENIFC